MTGRDRQTVADMAVEHCGSAEPAFAIARRNGIAIDTEVAGMELMEEPVADRRIKDYIATAGVSPANLYEADEDVLTTDDESENVVTEEEDTIS